MEQTSYLQLSWSIRQAALLSGRSKSAIIYMISKNRKQGLSEERGEVIIERKPGAKKSHYIITRKGMERLTGYKFEKIDYIELAKTIIEIVTKPHIYSR